MKEINCPKCNQHIKILGTDYDLYLENLKRKEQEIKRLKEEYVMLQNASDEVEEEKDKEIERLKDDNEYLNKVNIELSSEKNRLRSIIKEVREYINSIGWNTTIGNIQDNVWKILDKVGSDKD